MNKCYCVKLLTGSYEDYTEEVLAVFKDKSRAESWASAMQALINYIVKESKEKDDEKLNVSVFGIERIRQIINWNEWLIKTGYSIEIEEIDVLD